MTSAASATAANRFLRLPMTFDVARLRADLDVCVAREWRRHFNERDYDGSWTGIALRSASGAADDILAHDAALYRDTPLLDECPYFRTVVAAFHCEKQTVRLLRLAPGSRIHEHRDRGLGYQHGVFRVHVPIVTCDAVAFRVGGGDVPMRGGECWYADFDQPHSVANGGGHERVHLVLDCLRNDWSDGLFRAAGYDFDFEQRARRPDPETTRRIIAELAAMDTDAARALLARLQAGDGGS